MIRRIICVFLAAAIGSAALTSCVGKREPGDDTDYHGGQNTTADTGEGHGNDGMNTPGDAIYGDTLDDPGKVEVRTHEPRDYIKGSIACEWESTVFYWSRSRNSAGILYQDVNSPASSGILLYGDVLVGEDGNPFARSDGVSWMLVDERATVENGGVPVLLLAIGYTSIVGEGADTHRVGSYEIGEFDMLTNKWTVITSGADDVMQLALYRDTVFYITFGGGDEGYTLECCDRSGGGHKKLSTTAPTTLRLGYVYDDTVYYVDERTFSVYTCSLDLSEPKLMFDDQYHPIIDTISDGYIYYSAWTDEFGGVSEYFRRNLSAPDNAEFISDNATVELHYGHLYGFGDDDGRMICEYDPETGALQRVLSDISGRDDIDKSIIAIAETYIICDVSYDSDRDMKHLTCIDLSSGKEWKVPL